MDGSISLTGARVRRMEGILSEAQFVQVKVGGREYAQNHQRQPSLFRLAMYPNRINVRPLFFFCIIFVSFGYS